MHPQSLSTFSDCFHFPCQATGCSFPDNDTLRIRHVCRTAHDTFREIISYILCLEKGSRVGLNLKLCQTFSFRLQVISLSVDSTYGSTNCWQEANKSRAPLGIIIIIFGSTRGIRARHPHYGHCRSTACSKGSGKGNRNSNKLTL